MKIHVKKIILFLYFIFSGFIYDTTTHTLILLILLQLQKQ